MRRIHAIVRTAVLLAMFVMGMSMAGRSRAVQIGIPAGATIDSATLYVHSSYSTSGAQVRVHRLTAPWTETGVTWNNFNASYDPDVEASFASSSGTHAVDLTPLVRAWISGRFPNYGLLLEQDLIGFTAYLSSESDSVRYRPKLEICYSSATTGSACVTVQRTSESVGSVRDAYIWALNPDSNYGRGQTLYTGRLSGREKQSLLWFALPQIQAGCTLTLGYWKTHSKYGPAPYDDTWALVMPLGEESPFFDAGKTWYEALWTRPKKGNAYYILARQYIATYLNQLNGAYTPPEVADKLAHAAQLLDRYDGNPMGMDDIEGAIRQDFINTADMLDQYNNGYIGPDHCSE